ncbi:cilia- and flagella-associated protein 46 [Xenentodon cancila]
MDLDIREYLDKAKEHQDSEALQSAYNLLRTTTSAGDGAQTPRAPSELYVGCAETALQLGHMEMSTACLKMYFDGNPPANQFLCRALLCQGQLKSPPATGSVEDFEQAVMYFLKAIELSKSEPRYHFMVFNASVLYFQTVRPLLQSERCRHLVPSFKQVVQSLEEVADQEHSWRAELMMQVALKFKYSGQIEDAASFAKVTEEFTKSHAPQLYPRLYTLLVKHKLSDGDVLLETSRQSTALAVIYKIQALKKCIEINENNMTKEDSEKLEEIFCLLVDCIKAPSTPVSCIAPQSLPSIQPSERVAFFLELALLALQMKHQKVAASCLKELKSAGEANVDQRVLMECVNCELSLLKKGAKMNEYSKAGIEARLKEIERLDQLLQTAVREGSPQAVQAVCVTQWSFCLPFLQHSLRKRIKTPLLKLAQVLEDMQSMLLEVRCQVHSELAVTEEEEGCLEASLTHLQKATLLDNGTQRERLSSAFHLLQLRRTLYQTPTRTEDKAATLLQQIKDMPSQANLDIQPLLVSVGLLLAPDDFQTVLDADNTSKIPVGSLGSDPVAKLAATAGHHSTSVQRANTHGARQSEDKASMERAKLWATLARTARKLEIWNVCRAACRFCLLYDDGRWKISQTEKCRCSEEERGAQCLRGCDGRQTCVHLLRLLAEIHFISAEATIQKLLTEGVQMNSPAVRLHQRWEGVSEEDPHWVIYRDWIQALSAYATSNFLRAGELGAEIGEPWLVANAAIYLWNYNSHLLAAEEYQLLLPTFQTLLQMLQNTENTGNPTLCVLLCDAVARGLIQSVSERHEPDPDLTGDKGKNRADKGMEKGASVYKARLDHGAAQDVLKALELCDYALSISGCHITVPIAARKRVISTWLIIKRLLQQQISTRMDTIKCNNEEVLAMTRVLVGVEMLQCNSNPGHMDFSVPSLSTLVSMASECSWSDAVVELQVWCQLAAFCHHAKNHNLVLRCTHRALQLEEAAAKNLSTMPCVLYGPSAVNEMLSSAACLRGLSLIHESIGDIDAYRLGLKVLLSSVSFAEKSESQVLCVTAAGHYWNACLALSQRPQDRFQFKEHLEMILNALVRTTKHETAKGKRLHTIGTFPHGISRHGEAKDEENLTLRANIYSFLLHLHIDKADFKSALQLLDEAIRGMPPTRHRLPLLKYRILIKGRLGESVALDMQKLQEDSQCCSLMWHQVAVYADTVNQQLTCYQKAITSFTSTDSPWQKVSILLEFGKWLYSNNFSKVDAQHQVQWAIDILLHVEPGQAEELDGETNRNLTTLKRESLVGVHGLFTHNLSSLKEVCRLDYLMQAHTLLAVMLDKSSYEHELNLLRANTFALHIWQASMAVAREISADISKSQQLQTQHSAESRLGKDKEKGRKGKDPTPSEETLQPVFLDLTVPSTTTEWARYVCPDLARQIFRTSSSPQCVNTHSITKQTQSLFYLSLLEKQLRSLSLAHLTLPILHLAETIAHDLLDRRSLSDLYRLRIVRTCIELGLESQSPYQETLLTLSRIQEQEQMGCHKAITLSQERKSLQKAYNQKAELGKSAVTYRQNKDVSAQDIWLHKADVCLSLGLYQSARQLLAHALTVATSLGEEKAVSKSVLSLAALACEEQDYAQALILLDQAQNLGGGEEFWYQFSLTKIAAVVGQRGQDSQSKVDLIIKQGCEALQLVLGQQVNRVAELKFMITSLRRRGAVECIHASGDGKPGETLSPDFFQKLAAACDTLGECASSFTKLGCREQAAETHTEHAHGLRLQITHHTDRDEKRRFLLDGLSHMQLAVTLQEEVVLNAQNQLPSQEVNKRPKLSLVSMRTLLRFRLTLAEFSLTILEEHCAQKTQQALAHMKKTSAEIALEEFTCSTPEPNSTEQEWLNVGRTVEQLAVGQLAAVSSHSANNVETRTRCLSLLGKYLRLLAVKEEPMYPNALWHEHKQEASCDPKGVPMEEESSERDSDSSRKELGTTSTRSAGLQQITHKAQQLLAEASKLLFEAVSLCLQHSLPSSILADVCLNILECHGQSDPAVAGQYLAMFQSCCTVATVAEVLNAACADTDVSQLAALLSVRKNLLLSQEQRPSSMLKGVENSLNSLSKAFSHLTVSPNHLNILSELPSSLKILLLQHTDDGSVLYGGFYEATRAPENPKGKTTQATGTLTCSRVAKVSVCPRALLALRERTRAFVQETKHSPLNDDSLYSVEGWQEPSKEHQNISDHKKLAHHFRDIVKDMEDYLDPLLSQFDFSFVRPAAASLPVSEMTQSKDKEEEGTSGQDVVVLADRNLLELPLESLSILREEALNSVSRDFSLQLLYSRLHREKPLKAEGDNKKNTKGGKETKGKEDQNPAIKAVMGFNSHVDIVDPYNEGRFGGTTLCFTVSEVLKTHSQHRTLKWEGFMGSKETPSLSEMEQMLCRCSAFMYVGMDPFVANISPAKLAALNLSECCMALLFDRVQNKVSALRQSNLERQKSVGQLALEKPLETALLLSLGGVGCIILNQWNSSLQQTVQNVATVLDNPHPPFQLGQVKVKFSCGTTGPLRDLCGTGTSVGPPRDLRGTGTSVGPPRDRNLCGTSAGPEPPWDLRGTGTSVGPPRDRNLRGTSAGPEPPWDLRGNRDLCRTGTSAGLGPPRQPEPPWDLRGTSAATGTSAGPGPPRDAVIMVTSMAD